MDGVKIIGVGDTVIATMVRGQVVFLYYCPEPHFKNKAMKALLWHLSRESMKGVKNLKKKKNRQTIIHDEQA